MAVERAAPLRSDLCIRSNRAEIVFTEWQPNRRIIATECEANATYRAALRTASYVLSR